MAKEDEKDRACSTHVRNKNNTFRVSVGTHSYEYMHRDTTMKVTNKMQVCRLIYYSYSALHVSDDIFAHHQEHLTVFTVSGGIHPSCCRHHPAATWVNNTRYCKYR